MNQNNPTGGQPHEAEALITELNISYLLLAQDLIRRDRATARVRLGIDEDVCDVLSALTPPQILRMSASGVLLCQFRVSEGHLLTMLTSGYRTPSTQRAHDAVLAAEMPIAALVS